ncbi:MAG: extracellular solute-binding protein [Chloroflexi bacterium]|nr:extracellular solute-binding protein [Chloroflexota bacterium]
MKVKSMFLLTLLVLVVLAACAPAPTSVPPTAAPVATAVPPTKAPEPTKAVAATAAPTSAPAATTAPTSAPAATTAPTGPTATRPPATATSTPRPPAVTAAPGAVKINVWHHFSAPEQVEMMQKFADEFNAKNPQYYVVVTLQGTTSDIGKKINAAITANALPEIATGNPGDVFDWNTSGAVVALDDYIKDAKDGLTADQLAEMTMKLPNGELFFDQIGGKTFGISPGRSTSVLYYNADMLKAAGFNEPPKTWDDFDKICAAVTKGDNYCFAINSPSVETSTFATWVFSRGGTYASADEKKATFDDATGVDSLKWLKNLVDKGWAKVPSTTTRGDQADFGNGKLAFTFGSTAGLPFYSDAVKGRKEGPFAWSIALYPAGPKGKQVVDFFGPSMAMFKTTADRQRGAWLFIKFLFQPQNLVEFGLRLSYFPATKSARDAINAMDAAAVTKTNARIAAVLPEYKKGLGFIPSGAREPIAPAWQGARAIIQNMLTAVSTNKSSADFTATDPEGAAKEGVQRVNKQLESYGK